MKIREAVYIIAILGLIYFLAGPVATGMVKSDKKDITAWLDSQNEKVKNIEFRVWDTGPFIVMKSCRFYRVETDKGIYWVRYAFSRSIKKEINDTEYITIEE
jgi:hypothetical protein